MSLIKYRGYDFENEKVLENLYNLMSCVSIVQKKLIHVIKSVTKTF
ncbi:TPA: hypothetical protein ACG3P2_003452 [Clostridioides difficile]